MSNVQLIEDINEQDFKCINDINNESFNSEKLTTKKNQLKLFKRFNIGKFILI